MTKTTHTLYTRTHAQASATATEASLRQQLAADAEAAAETLRAVQAQAAATIQAAQAIAEQAHTAGVRASTEAAKSLEEMQAQVGWGWGWCWLGLKVG